MTPQQWRRVKKIFDDVVGLPRKDWSAALDERCDEDADIRQGVREMLAEWAGESGTAPQDPLIGKRVGSYRIVHRIGNGGMGVVYLAEQQTPFRRRAALKIVKRGMDSDEIVARFEAERQTLALMNHPGIARVLDAGATADGRPFFAMEYVNGVPITEYCDRERLTIRKRLKLFIRLCEAIQHAHQKAIIHRDIKPSNILIETLDDGPSPKVIDFGVAKALEHSLTDRTVLTQTGVQIGTPAYMSPEQAGRAGNVDTRTDIYSLGAVLYELLVGVQPFDPVDLRFAGCDGMRRILREKDPPTLAARVGELGERASQIAERRHTDSASLIRELRLDLDWICGKALEKDPGRRYASASELAADIRRHLENQPVMAGPPGAWYRAQKFVRRHRLGTAAGLAVILTLVAAVTATTWSLLQARRAERAAIQTAETAQQVSEFLMGLFDGAELEQTLSRNAVAARPILDHGAETIRQGLTDQPRVQLNLMNTIARVYLKFGFRAEAQSLFEEALERGADLFGEVDLEVADSLSGLGGLFWRTAEYEKAASFFQRGLRIREARRSADLATVAENLANLAVVLWKMERLEEARTLLERAVSIREKIQGPDHPDFAADLDRLAFFFSHCGQLEAARQKFEQVLRIRERWWGSEHTATADALENLGNALRRLGKYRAAAASHRRAALIRGRVLGSNHPHVALSMENLGLALWRSGDRDEAAAQFDRAYRIRRSALLVDPSVTPGKEWPAPHLDVEIYEKKRHILERHQLIHGEKLSPNPAFSRNDLAVLATAPAYGPTAPPGFSIQVLDRARADAAAFWFEAFDLAVDSADRVYYLIGNSLRRFEPSGPRIEELATLAATGLAIDPTTGGLLSNRLNSDALAMDFVAIDAPDSEAIFRTILAAVPFVGAEIEISPSGALHFIGARATGPWERKAYRLEAYRFDGGAWTAVTTQLPSPMGMAFAPNGDLYVTDTLADSVFRFLAEGAGPVHFGNVKGMFARSIARDPIDGDFYCATANLVGGGAAIERLPMSGGTSSLFAFGFSDSIPSLKFDSRGNLYALANEGSSATLYRITKSER